MREARVRAVRHLLDQRERTHCLRVCWDSRLLLTDVLVRVVKRGAVLLRGLALAHQVHVVGVDVDHAPKHRVRKAADAAKRVRRVPREPHR